MRKIKCYLLVIVLALFTIIFMSMINNRNSLQKEIVEYTEYLYFNWIDYPNQAKRLDSISIELNENLFSMFGYDDNGIPIKALYDNINYKYDGIYIFDKKYIGIPFEENDELYYNYVIINNL